MALIAVDIHSYDTIVAELKAPSLGRVHSCTVLMPDDSVVSSRHEDMDAGLTFVVKGRKVFRVLNSTHKKTTMMSPAIWPCSDSDPPRSWHDIVVDAGDAIAVPPNRPHCVMSDPETIAVSLTFKQAQRVDRRPRRRLAVTDVLKPCENLCSNDASPAQAPSPPPISDDSNVDDEHGRDHYSSTNVTAQVGLTGRLMMSEGILPTRPPGQSSHVTQLNVKHVNVTPEPAECGTDNEIPENSGGHVSHIYNAIRITTLIKL